MKKKFMHKVNSKFYILELLFDLIVGMMMKTIRVFSLLSFKSTSGEDQLIHFSFICVFPFAYISATEISHLKMVVVLSLPAMKRKQKAWG